MNVADLQRGEFDTAGRKIRYFYARNPPHYAVYQTRERVVVHFADDPAKEEEQRKALAQLAPLRGETNGLLDSWRDMPPERWRFWIIKLTNGMMLRERARRYDRRIADALIVGLEGDLTGAGAVMQDVKDDVLEERVGWSRFEYLMMAIGIAVGFMLVGGFLSWAGRQLPCEAGSGPVCYADARDLWRGAMAGALGAFFSIALAIKGRTVLPDLNRTANLMDAALRVTIGIIAGTVLVALVLEEFVSISIGKSSANDLSDLYVGIAGFLGGFAERLVPDLLAKADAKTGETPVLRRAEAPVRSAPEAGEGDGPAKSPGDGAPPGAEAPAIVEEHVDGCVEDIDLTDDDLTEDADLPAAAGGVETVIEPPAKETAL